MKARSITTFAALAACLALRAYGDAAEATSAVMQYALDTLDSPPRAVKSAADRATTVPYRAGETVTATAPDGTVKTLVADAASGGAAALSALDAGGVWTLANSGQGSATFSVRHSLFGTLGNGTAASPAKLVDGDELVDYSAGDGYVFSLADGGASLFAALRMPAGVRLEEADGGAWRLVASQDGLEYIGAETASRLDTKETGPDRTTSKDKALAVAYTGDNWARSASAAATLTLAPPTGSATVMNLTGTGATPFVFSQPGQWTLTLAMTDGATRTALLDVRSEQFVMVVR